MPQMLYDSERFVVVHDVRNGDELELAVQAGMSRAQIELMVQHVYEIVDKKTQRTLCLHGAWAEVFLQVTTDWMHNTPDQEVVEQVLDSYAQLAQIPVNLH